MPYFLHHPIPSLNTQKGSIAINAVIAISVIIIALIGTELGYLFLTKRELQKAADLAALAGAQRLELNICDAAINAAKDNANGVPPGAAPRNLPQNLVLEDGEISCGHWDATESADATGRNFVANVQPFNAVRVLIRKTPDVIFPHIPGNLTREIVVEAIAAEQHPRAILNIRSTLLSIEDKDSPLLNAIIGGLLGGSLDLDAVSWKGLVNTDIQLLQYLDVLAIDLRVSAGDYDQLLQTDASAQQLIQAAITVLSRQTSAPGDALSLSLSALEEIKKQIHLGPIAPLKLGELLGIQSGTSAAGLDTTLQVFKLMEGIVQLANSHSAVAATIPITIPGAGSILVKTKVIEPPQISAAGNPALAQIDPMGPDKIFVRTAQVRALISIEFGDLISTLNDLLNTVFAKLAPITSFINNVLSLNLVQAVGNFLGGLACPIPFVSSCPSSEAIFAKVTPAARLDIGLEAASGEAYVREYTCNSGEKKSLTVPATTAAVTIRVGQWGKDAAQAESAFFSPEKLPEVETVSLIEIGKQTVRPDSCVLTICKDLKWKQGSSWIVDRKQADFTLEAALGIRADTKVAGASKDLFYEAPAPESLPEITQQPFYQKISSENIVQSLKSILTNVDIEFYKSISSGLLGNLLFDATNLLGLVTTQLTAIIDGLLSPLLDPLLNFLLQALGINVAATEVGARLSCKNDVVLVY